MRRGQFGPQGGFGALIQKSPPTLQPQERTPQPRQPRMIPCGGASFDFESCETPPPPYTNNLSNATQTPPTNRPKTKVPTEALTVVLFIAQVQILSTNETCVRDSNLRDCFFIIETSCLFQKPVSYKENATLSQRPPGTKLPAHTSLFNSITSGPGGRRRDRKKRGSVRANGDARTGNRCNRPEGIKTAKTRRRPPDPEVIIYVSLCLSAKGYHRSNPNSSISSQVKSLLGSMNGYKSSTLPTHRAI